MTLRLCVCYAYCEFFFAVLLFHFCSFFRFACTIFLGDFLHFEIRYVNFVWKFQKFFNLHPLYLYTLVLLYLFILFHFFGQYDHANTQKKLKIFCVYLVCLLALLQFLNRRKNVTETFIHIYPCAVVVKTTAMWANFSIIWFVFEHFCKTMYFLVLELTRKREIKRLCRFKVSSLILLKL